MKRILLLIAFGIVCAGVYGQQRAVVKGTVIDGIGDGPLIGATVILDSTRSMATDANGAFSFSNTDMKKGMRLEVSYLGYETYRTTVDVEQAQVDLGRIVLREGSNQLEKVVVETETVMSVMLGDTVQFNANAFKVNPDADAGDLINKMPGITVEDGKIEAQGETVTRVYVDGKLLFGEDTSAPLTNLPADLIESVQVFDELSDEAKFVGYDDGNTNKALNIVTKHKINRSTVARVEAGYGFDTEKDPDGNRQGRYYTGATFSTFTEKNKWNVNGTVNNVNRRRAADRDEEGSAEGGGIREIGSISVGYAGTRGDNDQTKLTANYNYMNSRNKNERQSIQDYFPTDEFDTRTFADTSSSRYHFANHNLWMRFEQQWEKDQIDFQPNFNLNTSDGKSSETQSNTVDGILENRSISSSKSDRSNYSFGGNLRYRHLFSQSTSAALTMNTNVTDTDNKVDRFIYDEVSMEDNRIHRKTVQDSKSFGGDLSVSQRLGEYHRLMANYGMSYQKSNYDVHAYDLVTGDLDSTTTNVYSRNNTTKRGGLSYNFNKDRRYTLNMRVQYQAVDVKRTEDFPIQGEQSKWTFYNWVPSVRFQYRDGQTMRAAFSYRGNSNLPDVNRLQNVINNSSTLQLSAGNANLKQSYSHNFEGTLTKNNVEKNSYLNAGINATLTRNRISNKTEYFSSDTVLAEYGNYLAVRGSQLTTPVNLNGYVTVRGRVGYSFPFALISSKLDLEGVYQFTRTPGYSGTQLNKANANSLGFNFKVASNISENVDFDISSRSTYQFVSHTVQDNTTYFRERVTARVNVIFLGGFVFNTTFNYNFTRNKSSYTTTNTYNVWNAGIGRKFLRNNQAEVRVTVYDILNQNTSNMYSIMDNYVQDSWSNSLGRYVMATATYRFNSLNKFRGNNRSEGEERGMGPGSGERRGPGGMGGGAGGPRGGMGGGF